MSAVGKKRPVASISNGTEDEDGVVHMYTGSGRVPRDVVSVKLYPWVKEVKDNAFCGCNKLTKIVFNEGLKKIGKFAFFKCISLKNIDLPSTLEEIGYNAFNGCGKLTNVTLPSSVKVVRMRAFFECTGLQKVIICEGIKKIGADAFLGCKLLQTVNFPSTLVEIENGAFCGCGKLKDIILNEGLQKIGQGAFMNCNLRGRDVMGTRDSSRSITLPSSINEIGAGAFRHSESNYESLTEVVIRSENIQWLGKDYDSVFSGCFFVSRGWFKVQLPNVSACLKAVTDAGYSSAGIENIVNSTLGALRYDGIRKVVMKDGELLIDAVSTWGYSDKEKTDIDRWNKTKARIDQALTLIESYHKLKEATSILELALWKFKIDTAEDSPVDREACRFYTPGPVKETILQYLLPVELQAKPEFYH